jgi:hypothetical protein
MAAPDVSTRSSRDLSGSVYLITSDGRMLSLPIPTKSRRDPLNWSTKKRAGAFTTVIFFAVNGLLLVQAPSLMFHGLREEYGSEVRIWLPWPKQMLDDS